MQPDITPIARLFSQPKERDLQWISLSYQDLYSQNSAEVLDHTVGVYLQAIDARESNAPLILRRIVKSLADLSQALEVSLHNGFLAVEGRLSSLLDAGCVSSSTLIRERTAYVIRLMHSYKVAFITDLAAKLSEYAANLAFDRQHSVRLSGILLCQQLELYDELAILCDDTNEQNRQAALKALPCSLKYYDVLERRAKDLSVQVRLEVFSKVSKLAYEDLQPDLLIIIVESAAYDRSPELRRLCQEIFQHFFTARLNLEFCCELADKLQRPLKKRRFLKAFTSSFEQMLQHTASTELIQLAVKASLETDFLSCRREELLFQAAAVKHYNITEQIAFSQERVQEVSRSIKELVRDKDYFAAESLFFILTSNDVVRLQYREEFHELWQWVLRNTDIESTGRSWSIPDQNFKPMSGGVELLKLVIKTCQAAMGVEEFITTLGEFIQDLQQEVTATLQLARNCEDCIANFTSQISDLETAQETLIHANKAGLALQIQDQIRQITTSLEQSKAQLNKENPLTQLARILVVSCELMRNCDRMSYCFDFKTHIYEYALTCCNKGLPLLSLAIEVVNLYCYLEPEAFTQNSDYLFNWLSFRGEDSQQVRLAALTVIFDNLLMRDYFHTQLVHSAVCGLLKAALNFLDADEDDVLNVTVEGFAKLLLFNRAGDNSVEILRSFLSIYYSEVSVTDYVKQLLQVFLRNYAMISLANCRCLEKTMKQILSQSGSFDTSLIAEVRYRERSKNALKHLLSVLTNKDRVWSEPYNFHFAFLVFLVLKSIEYCKSNFSEFTALLTEVLSFDEFNEQECWVADVLLVELLKAKPKNALRLRAKLKNQQEKLGRSGSGEALLEAVTREHDINYNFLFVIQIKSESGVQCLPGKHRLDQLSEPKKVIKIED
jgi:hypothetical protein